MPGKFAKKDSDTGATRELHIILPDEKYDIVCTQDVKDFIKDIYNSINDGDDTSDILHTLLDFLERKGLIHKKVVAYGLDVIDLS